MVADRKTGDKADIRYGTMKEGHQTWNNVVMLTKGGDYATRLSHSNKLDPGLGLEESLQQFESGIKLAKSCQDTLANAELRVEQLIEKNGLQQTVPLEDLDED